MILKSEIEDEYIFYNSNTHLAIRCSLLEIYILELVYKYGDPDYISDHITEKYKEQVKDACKRIIMEDVLSLNPPQKVSERQKDRCLPTNFYLHLTYKCNLSCTYCYNRKIRTNHKDLNVDKWKIILNKILPVAKDITLTGGEPFLYKGLITLLKYIKGFNPSINIGCISNCMHDFSCTSIQEALNYIDSITFSCDSISEEKDRIAFNPKLFKRNICFLKENNKNLKMAISVTLSQKTKSDIYSVIKFGHEHSCYVRRVPLVPTSLEQISDMVSISDFKKMLNERSNNGKKRALGSKQTRCGAGRNVCSIDPLGNIYPCQCLHYPTFLMGNILKEELSDMKFINQSKGNIEDFILDVDKLPGCKNCRIKYICGGGCLATSFFLDGSTADKNKYSCPYNYEIAISKLRNIP